MDADAIMALSTGDTILVQWGGEGPIERVQFESREGVPTRRGWVVLGDIIDGVTKVWRDESTAPLSTSRFEDALESIDATWATAREAEASSAFQSLPPTAKGNRFYREPMTATAVSNMQDDKILCRWEIGELKIEAKLYAEDAKGIHSMVIASLTRDTIGPF